jgi:tetratricopeptide (TPR) repeat protein
MRMIVYLGATLLAVSCGGKKDDKSAPAPVTKEGTPPKDGSAGSGGSAAKPDPAAKPVSGAATVPVTSKSPDAIKAFEQGRELVDGERGIEAVELFKKAIELDADFADAHAYLGIVTPGPDGMKELDKAKELAAKLPESEKLVIEGIHASRSGNHAGMLTAYNKVAELAPGDWHIWLMLGSDANATTDHAKAIKYFEKALAIKPDLAFAHDGLAQGHAGLREWEPAIASAKKQVELLPKQPNPQDTLGEIYLMAGKYDDAEKAFQAAVAIEPKYNIAWQGVALSRAYKGDWKGAFEANDSQNTGAVDVYDSVEVIIDSAWLSLASDDLDDAMARFDVLEKDADAKKTPAIAFAALERAFILQLGGKGADSVKWLDAGMTRGATLPGANRRVISRNHAIGVLRNAALSGKAAADTDKLLAGLDGDAKASGDPTSASYANWGHGLAAWAKTGAKDAVAELTKCQLAFLACRSDLSAAQRKAGDTAGADTTDKQIRESPQREASAVYFVAHATPAAPAPATPATPKK